MNINQIKAKILNLHRMNILKTIIVNFTLLKFKEAIKFPFYVYGKIKIHDLSGKVEFTNGISSGLIKFGYYWFDQWPTSLLPSQINIKGKLIIKGPVIISGGVSLSVQGRNAVMSLGHKCTIGGGSLIKAIERIDIGDYAQITGNCIVMDSNMHFVKNVESGEIKNCHAPIVVGNYCWINAGTIISKGAAIPDYSISARNSYLSKDYSELGTNIFLAGSPAKVISRNVQRIFSKHEQDFLKIEFEKTNSDILYKQPGVFVEPGDMEGF